MPSFRSLRSSLKAVAAGATFAVLLAACGGGGNQSPAASPGGSPAGSPAGGAGLQISANGLKFDKSELQAPANTAFKIAFENKEAVPHNVAIPSKQFVGEVFSGPGTRTYDVPSLPAGSYEYICSVHPDMKGTLVVK